MNSKSNNLLVTAGPLLLICGIALSLRIIYLLQFKEMPFFYHLSLDPLFYDRSALSILNGNYLLGKEVLDMGPLYSYFLAAVYALSGHDLFAARIVQVLTGTLSCLLIYSIGLNVFDKKTALTASFISALYGPFIFTEGNLISESLVIFTNLLIIAMLIEAREKDSLFLWYLSGLLLGISAIIRPNILFFAPLALLWIFSFFRKEGTAKSILHCFLFFAGTITAIAPVTARNYLLTGDRVLITSSGGLNFYLGNNKDASGILTEPAFIRPDPAYEHKDARKEAE
ncbi:MAG: glycosyltransferase family 39 protein, partial [Deltaproteobacteria bacterium]|nr:glycosyltransferase family 39 protein [Deltaproteobacteria bacterium]